MYGSIIKGSLLSLAVASMLTGCGSDKDDMLPAEYEVSISNMSNFQPLSPVGIIFGSEESFFEIGAPASLALEKLAEGGDNSELLATGKTSASTQSPVLPGETAILNIRKDFGDFKFSAFSMLVNTNDAFTGVNAYDLNDLEVGETVILKTNAYDAGTEGNSEAAGTIPGPADVNGEGFNAIRDDSNVVHMHSGVVTKDDGLSSSVLTEQAKFDNTVMRVSIRRTK